MNAENCKDILCKQEMHSLSDWRKGALKKKKELQNAGIAEYESHPEYQEITKCKPEDNIFPLKSECDRSSPVRTAYTSKKGRCPKGTRFNKRTQNCEPSKSSRNKPASPGRPSSPGRPGSAKKRCPNGTKRNKRTGNCEPSKSSRNRPATPGRPASPVRPNSGKSKKRCPNGTRFNKRTQNCEPKK